MLSRSFGRSLSAKTDVLLKKQSTRLAKVKALSFKCPFLSAPVGSFVASSARRDAPFGIAPRNASRRYASSDFFKCSGRLLRRLLRTCTRSWRHAPGRASRRYASSDFFKCSGRLLRRLLRTERRSIRHGSSPRLTPLYFVAVPKAQRCRATTNSNAERRCTSSHLRRSDRAVAES